MHLKLSYSCKVELWKAKEAKNSPTDGEIVRPQALDQSYKLIQKISRSLANGVSWSSKIRLFLSLQIVHIRQEGIKFQTLKHLFPNQFHQPKSISGTWEGITHSIPTNWNTKPHNCLAAQQCNEWMKLHECLCAIEKGRVKTVPSLYGMLLRFINTLQNISLPLVSW